MIAVALIELHHAKGHDPTTAKAPDPISSAIVRSTFSHSTYSVPRRGLRREAAARYVRVSTGKFDECVRDGRMPQPFRIDACVIWDLRRLDARLVKAA